MQLSFERLVIRLIWFYDPHGYRAPTEHFLHLSAHNTGISAAIEGILRKVDIDLLDMRCMIRND